MISIEDVIVTYPGADSPALDGVTLRIDAGEMVCLLGANGSGKSTLARLCNALLVPGSGAVTVDGMDTADESVLWEVRSRVGFVQQNPENQIVGTVAEEDVAFGPENLGVARDELRRRVDEALEVVGLSGLQRREPHMLSEGQKQRLAIAGALAMRPAYLVLDEPTAMLDGAGREDVSAVLRRLRADGVGILHVTHHVGESIDADRIAVLDAGRIVYEGTPSLVLADVPLAESLGIELPPVAHMNAALRERGIDVPALTLDAVSIVDAIWRS
jgi:energy-coupling factor transport system ATP-binding protein